MNYGFKKYFELNSKLEEQKINNDLKTKRLVNHNRKIVMFLLSIFGFFLMRQAVYIFSNMNYFKTKMKNKNEIKHYFILYKKDNNIENIKEFMILLKKLCNINKNDIDSAFILNNLRNIINLEIYKIREIQQKEIENTSLIINFTLQILVILFKNDFSLINNCTNIFSSLIHLSKYTNSDNIDNIIVDLGELIQIIISNKDQFKYLIYIDSHSFFELKKFFVNFSHLIQDKEYFFELKKLYLEIEKEIPKDLKFI
jgi:hypothetical protein